MNFNGNAELFARKANVLDLHFALTPTGLKNKATQFLKMPLEAPKVT